MTSHSDLSLFSATLWMKQIDGLTNMKPDGDHDYCNLCDDVPATSSLFSSGIKRIIEERRQESGSSRAVVWFRFSICLSAVGPKVLARRPGMNSAVPEPLAMETPSASSKRRSTRNGCRRRRVIEHGGPHVGVAKRRDRDDRPSSGSSGSRRKV